MKKYLYCFLLWIAIGQMAIRADATWSKISIGEYQGCQELFAVNGGKFVLLSDAGIIDECDFSVTKEGVNLGSKFYSWDAPGLQASRKTENSHSRINFLGRVGNVFVTELSIEEPKDKVIRVLRMFVAPISTKIDQ